MPAAQIEGAPQGSAPDGFTGDDEPALIGFLAAQKAKDADFNAYRHLAPLLHHAVRAGMNDTVVWLLFNGANPLLLLSDPTEGAHGGGTTTDAVAVAIIVNNWTAFDALMQHPKLKALRPQQLVERYWPFAGKSTAATQALVTRNFPLPRFAVVPNVAAAILIDNLCNGELALATAALAAEPAAHPVVPPDAPAHCPISAPQAEPAAPPSALQWRRLQDRLRTPMFAFALHHVRTADDLLALEQAGVRPDWTHAARARQQVLVVLQQDRPALREWLRRQPPLAVKAALKDDAVFRAWMQSASGWPMADFQWALDQVEPDRIGRNLSWLMTAWDYLPLTARNAKDPLDHLQRWSALTERLPPRLPDAAAGALPYIVPLELWADWLGRGVRVSDEDWSGWLRWVDNSHLEKAWPVLEKSRPEVARRSLSWLVAPVSVGPTDDPQAQALSRDNQRYWFPNNDRVARLLYAKGVRVAQPRWLAAAFDGPRFADELTFLLEHDLVRRPPDALRKQLELAPLECKLVASPALRRSLAASPSARPDALSPAPASIDTLGAVAQPGRADCIWIGLIGEFGGRKFIEEESFFDGANRLTPCTDGDRSVAAWDEKSSRWTALADSPNSALIAVRTSDGQRQALVSVGEQQGGCGSTTGDIYQVTANATGDPAKLLVRLAPNHLLAQALSLQCDARDTQACFGLEQDHARDNGPWAIETFADRHWPVDKQAFLSAIEALDRPALRAALEQGVFAHWGREAIRRTSASAMELEPKRRRMAWLLAQPQVVLGLDYEMLLQLANWLPAEDWGPIIRSMRCSNVYALESLQQTLAQKGHSILGNRLLAAIGAPCKAAKR